MDFSIFLFIQTEKNMITGPSIIDSLVIQNIPSFLKEFRHYALIFPALTKYNTTLSSGFLGQRFNNLQQAARTFDVILTSSV